MSDQLATEVPPLAARGGRPRARGPRGGTLGKALRALAPLAWVGPAVALIGVVVIWPVVVMVQTSFKDIDSIGFDHGYTGTKNYDDLFDRNDLAGVIERTAVWTIAVVVVTMLLSLALAQLFNQRFPGRRVARWALIAPWAASVMMTAVIFRWALDGSSGVINIFLHDLGLVHLGSQRADWLGRPTSALIWMMVVAVFVSLPFTTYALLAGLQTIPGEVYEAGRVDGAGRWRTYLSITLPLLRPALIVAALINIINVFNSFPIIWEMTRGGPGYKTATSTVFMFQLKDAYVGQAAAMSVFNFVLVILVVLLFLRMTKWREQVSS